MRIEIVAVGTELLLGQITDTNSQWMGEHLAAVGVTSQFHQAVGDNHDRMVLAFRTALARSDGVIVCGGLGPTHDDITRDAIAEVMNVPLHRDADVVERIRAMFSSRGREMPDSNLRQADVPEGATIIPQTKGTAPGLICPVGHKVIYAVPGVPYEMADMFERAIVPDLQQRMAEAGESTGVIASRVLRTWGMSESGLAEALAGHIARLDAPSAPEGAAGHRGRGDRRVGHHRLPGQRDRGDQGPGHGAGRGRTGGIGAVGCRGGRDPAGPGRRGRGRGVRRGRGGHRGCRGRARSSPAG